MRLKISRFNRSWMLCLVIACLSLGHLLPVHAGPSCPADELICLVPRIWTEDDVKAHIPLPPQSSYATIKDDDGLTLVFHRPSTSINPIGIFWADGQGVMTQVDDTVYWTATFWFEGIDDATLSFGLSDDGNYRYPFATYRGSNAPMPSPINDPLVGSLKTGFYKSEVLGVRRTIFVYLPPNHDPSKTYPTIYMTDGESLPDYAGSIDYLITEGVIPPMIVVGTASAQPVGNRNVRGEEYVIGRNPTLFDQHAQFFTQEIREWAETTLGASKERSQRGIFGISNGGLFAIVMSVQHPELYGFVFTFSAGASAGFDDSLFTVDSSTVQLPLSVYGTAGTLEPIFLETTQRFVQAYEDTGADTTFSQNVAGHDNAIWQVELPKALRWTFGQEGQE